MLTFVGLNLFEIFEVPVFEKDFILTVKIGHPSLPKIVLVHGFASGSGFFYLILKALSETFQIYMIDLLGMGGSSRPQFDLETPQECVDFFLNSIEEWRGKMGL